ncbi:hypothetical protein AciPR4_0960 [Terriglobus saanensis SP1PR4]|uniref:Uncharacterized protein n=2 Tax=Terriglobus saanensis TaxID=870903 RepID=E8V890_TERSS|nr:hypothetical protein AciPR4_0960 [Terriglobus saanensis SP1PR4]
MRNLPVFFGCALAASALAQVGVTTPAAYRGVMTVVDGVYVTPIPNIPMTATVDISSMRILPDGTQELRKTLNEIARDSRGRIYNERRAMVPVTFEGKSSLQSAHIFDPQTRQSVFLNPHTHLAREMTLPDAGNRPVSESGIPPAPHGAAVEDLGQSNLAGVNVHGVRYTIQIAGIASGTGKPLQIKDEYWYSDQLRLNMMVVHDDPRTGQQIVMIKQVSQREPDSKLFQVPEGYRVVDETPVQTAPPSREAAPRGSVAPVGTTPF